MYVVIEDDEKATLRVQDGEPTLDRVEAELRCRGWNRVRPAERTTLMGYVSDVSAVTPELFRPNTVGALVMAGLGHVPLELLHGPVVVTGYDPEWGPDNMDRKHVKLVAGIYTAVLDSLGRPAPDLGEYAEPEAVFVPDDKWRAANRELAARWAGGVR